MATSAKPQVLESLQITNNTIICNTIILFLNMHCGNNSNCKKEKNRSYLKIQHIGLHTLANLSWWYSLLATTGSVRTNAHKYIHLYKMEFPHKPYLMILQLLTAFVGLSALWFESALWSVSKVSPLAGVLNIAHMFRTSIVWHDEESSWV